MVTYLTYAIALDGDTSLLCYFHHDISSNVSVNNDSSMDFHEISEENDDALLAQALGAIVKRRGKYLP